MFEEHYHNMIAQLLHVFPSDYKTKEGVLFWSGPKRCPQVANFDPENVGVAFLVHIPAYVHIVQWCYSTGYDIT